MTCRSCGFENMKRSTVCARCGAKLVWDGPVRKQDFQPTGRTLGGGFRRRFFDGVEPNSWPVRVWRRAGSPSRIPGSWFAYLWRGVKWAAEVQRRIPSERRRWGMVSVLPGLSQILAGRTVRGTCLFAGWLALVAAVWQLRPDRVTGMAGSRAGGAAGPFPVLAFCVLALLHSFAIIDVIRPGEFCRTNGEVGFIASLAVIPCLILYGLIYYGMLG